MEAFIKFGAAAGILALVVSAIVFFRPAPVIVQSEQTHPLGAVSGPDVSFFTMFHDNMSVGGQDFATTSQGAATYTAIVIARARVIEHIAPAALTATLPTNAALSSAGFLPYAGDTQTLFIHASTTKITLAGNTGVTLYSASSTKDIAPGSIGRLECVRFGATEARLIDCFLSAD